MLFIWQHSVLSAAHPGSDHERTIAKGLACEAAKFNQFFPRASQKFNTNSRPARPSNISHKSYVQILISKYCGILFLFLRCFFPERPRARRPSDPAACDCGAPARWVRQGATRDAVRAPPPANPAASADQTHPHPRSSSAVGGVCGRGRPVVQSWFRLLAPIGA